MVETNMPTAEAEVAVDAEAAEADEERAHYELAFHILPTVVEGEVPDVFAAVKDMIAKADGTVTDEEAPQRFELAYEIVKHVEGKNRKFTSAYFGWVRFTAVPSAAHSIAHAVETRPDTLRHLLIRLTRQEEAHPFRFHEALASQKQVTDVDTERPARSSDSDETTTRVDETKLDEALKKDEA